MSKGGTRPGAGRPKGRTKATMSLTLTHKQIEQLKIKAEKENLTVSSLVVKYCDLEGEKK